MKEFSKEDMIEFSQWIFNKKNSIAYVDPDSKFYLMTTTDLFEFWKKMYL